jgi:hypothetical protein
MDKSYIYISGHVEDSNSKSINVPPILYKSGPSEFFFYSNFFLKIDPAFSVRNKEPKPCINKLRITEAGIPVI